ncbi:MAG: rhodanese-like domain-containing protein [Verrucomicrobia bacterium]|nr:MAG: rhodanese-like domain-containing protein [Verrucomicrobiota bacterium]TAE86045.1 MAG: rhodanese-like domain-containing protein [Verrucomicrobiota bacterium]TAF25834.1 MAG: rhodanese-like domain-containing protein [Verrucomicrobiota bacterium]
MKSLVFLGIILLASCQLQQSPIPANPAAPQAPSRAPRNLDAKLTSIDLLTLFPLQQKGAVLLYDARPAFVARFGKIPGAISWPRHQLDAQLPLREAEILTATRSGKTIVFYCTDADCPDAHFMAERMVAHGHSVSILDGGIASWKDAGLPTK